MLGEGGDLIVPHAAVAEAGVEQEEGRAVAGDVIGDLGAVDIGEAGLGGWHVVGSPR